MKNDEKALNCDGKAFNFNIMLKGDAVALYGDGNQGVKQRWGGENVLKGARWKH